MRPCWALALATALLTGCGGSGLPNGSPTPSPSVQPGTPSPSASATSPTSPLAGVVIVIAEPQAFPLPGQVITVRLLRPDGTERNHFIVPDGYSVVAASGSRIFILGQGLLKALGPDGVSADLGALGSDTQGVVVSPDGNRWLWSSARFGYDTISSAVHLGGIATAPKIVEQSTEVARALRPFAWTSRGVFIEHGAVGIGGYILFSPATGAVDRLDADRQTVAPLARTGDCAFSDLSSDGTIACFPSSDLHSLALLFADGHRLSVSLSGSRFNLVGDAYFGPMVGTLVVAGASGVGAAGLPEEFETDLVNESDGSRRPFGPAGVRPAMRAASWLPDGSLVVWRPKGASGGDPGIYILDSSGRGAEIPTEGSPVGYLTLPSD